MNALPQAFVACLLVPVLSDATAFAAEDRPMNVVLILADDLGWADTSLYGHTSLYETPNIERLARRGMTFTRAYSSSPLCAPTRASILTGQATGRHGSTGVAHHLPGEILQVRLPKAAQPENKVIMPQSVNRLDPAFPTLGKLLQGAGWKTGHFGKWHLGLAPYDPLHHGFDIDLPQTHLAWPAGGYLAPWDYKDFKAKFDGEHIEDRMAAEAVTWMRSVKDSPFFLNYWMFSPHSPYGAKPELIERYRGKVDMESGQRSPTYAAMVHSLDDAVGTLLDAVDELGLAERTIIIFTSDNGGPMYDGISEKDAAGKGYITEPTSNQPLRGGKGTMFEGGIRVPLVVVWPGVAAPGSRSDALIQCTDFYPTLLAALGVDKPADWTVDGVNIKPALQGKDFDRGAIFTYFPAAPDVPDWLPPSVAVHEGDWKLIRIFHHGPDMAHDYRLYNLKDDIGEKKNLAAAMPEKVHELDALIERHLQDAHAVVPVVNPKFDPAKFDASKIGVQATGLRMK
jgi:arylsulfatase A-like enzyme